MEWLRQAVTNIDGLKDFNYVVQDKYRFKPVDRVVSAHYNKVYDNPRISIWHYKHEGNENAM